MGGYLDLKPGNFSSANFRNLVPAAFAIVPSSSVPVSPLTILGSTVVSYAKASDVVIDSTFTWPDLSGNGLPWTNLTGSSGPSLNAADSSLNNKPTLTFNGSSQYCDCAYAAPIPGTTPVFYWAIIKINSWTANRIIIGGADSARCQVYLAPSSPSWRHSNTAASNDNSGLPVGTWGRAEIGFTNSTADYIKLASNAVTGSNAGNAGTSTVRRLASNAATSVFTSMSVAEFLIANAIPNPSQLAALDAYVTSEYGPGLV